VCSLITIFKRKDMGLARAASSRLCRNGAS
jgi:hypothetical protein